MRIAFDIASLAACGGAERQVLEVASGLGERGHHVLVIVNKTADAYTEYDGRVRISELHRLSRFDVGVALEIRQALRRFHPDVCVCVSFNASLWGRLAAASLGCGVAVAEHATRARPHPVIRLTNLSLGPVTGSVIACADAQVEALCREGHPASKITVVRNGVDITRFRPDRAGAARVRAELGIPADAPVVGLVAAHRPEKRHDRFISLIEQLSDQGVEAWGLMAGGGPLLARTVAAASASPAAPRLISAGARVDMPAVYSALDVAILVSESESFPLSFLEAQACGVPVVGFDIGGIRETMREGETGLLVAADDTGGLRDVVAGLLANGDRRARMGLAARELVERELSRDAMIDGYTRVLMRIADRRA